jgi:hypothetical protein
MEELWFLNSKRAAGLKLNLSCAVIKPRFQTAAAVIHSENGSSCNPAGKLKNDVILKKKYDEQFVVL